MADANEYVGDELELFAGAVNWKTWLAHQMRPHIGGRVLEVGAGLGANTRFLLNDRVTHWLSLEPDPGLAATIQRNLDGQRNLNDQRSPDTPRNLDDPRNPGQRSDPVAVRIGTTQDLPDSDLFDTILYIDVLEHIRDDRDELARAARHLAPSGRLIVLSPAHQFLFSPFDRAIGHERRYSRASLTALTPPATRIETARMLDSAGFFLSLGNRLLMRSAMPTRRQIELWDTVFVPMSRWLDRLTGYRFGKSILVVWTKA